MGQKKDEKDILKINKEFAQKYEFNARRKEIEQLESKHGKIQDIEQDNMESQESESSEDSQAALLTLKAEKKFADLLIRIKNKDMTLLQTEGEYFKESDFDDSNQDKDQNQDSKKITYKDVLREDVLKKIDKESDSYESDDEKQQRNQNIFEKVNGETLAEEEQRIKNEFKKQTQIFDNKQKKQKKPKSFDQKSSSADSQGNKQNYDSDDDDILVKKKNRSDSSDSEKPQKVEKQQKREKKLNMESDKDILQKLYGEQADLDKKDKFLLDYIMNERWKGANNNDESDEDNYQKYQQKRDEKIDREDLERESEMEEFEAKYNFRYEEKNSAYLTTFARQAPEDSMRRTDDRRTNKRLDAKAKKEEEQNKKKEEIEKLKALKKEEILAKLKKAEFLAGKIQKNDSQEDKAIGIFSDRKLLEKAEKELNTEFIPDLYDKTMDAIFDEKYYKASNNDGKELENNKDIDIQIFKDQMDKVGVDLQDDVSSSENLSEDIDKFDSKADKIFIQKQRQKKQNKYEEILADSIKKQVDQQETAQGFQTWYVCDECHKAINGGQYRFDCLTCPNFTFCEKCYKKNTKHVHRFKKQKISKDNNPPQNSDELIQKSYMLCTVCKDCLLDINKRVYICRTCSPNIEETGDAIYWCKVCKDSDNHEHQRERFKGLPGLVQQEGEDQEQNQGQKYLDSLLQEYYDLDCEDVIGGGQLKTRFKYINVPKENFGLTEEEILLLDDYQLNKFASIKQLRPYKHLDEDGNEIPQDQQRVKKLNEYKLRQLKQEFKEELEQKKKLVKENLKANLALEKELNLGGSQNAIKKAERNKVKQERKNKNAKYIVLGKKRKNEDLDQQNDSDNDQNSQELNEEINDKNINKKQKRLQSQYGLK